MRDKKTFSMLLTGDIILGDDSEHYFSGVKGVLERSDVVLGQLEVPYSDRAPELNGLSRSPRVLEPIAKYVDALTLAGNHLYDISNAIDAYVSGFGYGIVRDLVGHGVGTHLHEDPQIPNFAQKRKGIRLEKGMTLAIEPMINMGTWEVEWLSDGWTVVTKDGLPSAHYENTILITDGEPEILTLY